jgi:toxin ParE1/3/4
VRIDWLTLALADLAHIREFIGRDNPAAAMRVGERLEAITVHLARHPELGKEGRRAGTRELILPDLPFRIVYRVRGQEVQILRIYHSKRKWPGA